MIWRVFCYHGVNEHEAANFEAQIFYFKAAGWKFCTMTEALSLKPGNNEGKFLTITFDDGQQSLFKNAIPFLDKLEIKACLYITTDYVLKGNTYRDREPVSVMTWDQILEISKSGHEIGSHSHTHPRFNTIDEDVIKYELEISKNLIEDKLGIEVKHFAYPGGQHNRVTYQVLSESKYYQTAATIDRGAMKTYDELLIKRNVIQPYWSIRKIQLYNWLSDNSFLYNIMKLRRFI